MSESCRSCGAAIAWARTAKGARIPLDIERSENGNIAVDGGVARIVPAGEGDRTTHFATCPNATAHRRRSSAERHPSTKASPS